MEIQEAAVKVAIGGIEEGIAARPSWAQVGRNAIRDLQDIDRLNGWQKSALAQQLNGLKRGLGLGLIAQSAIDTINDAMMPRNGSHSPQRQAPGIPQRRQQQRGRGR
jgi:hypothetical protein